MRPLTLISFLLSLALCSCSSQQHISEYAAQAAESSVEQHTDRVVAANMFAAISSQSDFDISDINISFFPPDSTSTEYTTMPATVSIGKIVALRKTNSEILAKTTDSVAQALNINTSSDYEVSTANNKQLNAISPPSYVISIIVFALFVLAFFLYSSFKYRSK